MLKMIFFIRSSFISFLNIFSIILMITLNWSSDFDGIFIDIPPAIPFAFVRTSSTNRAN